MIRSWLTKHRLINELGKTIIAVSFGWFGCLSWEAGKLASKEIVVSDSYKLMVFGIATGIMGMLALFIFTDIVYSLSRHYKSKPKEVKE